MNTKQFTDGPWHACHNGECSCKQIWSRPFDAPILTVNSGEWGDKFPAWRINAAEQIEAYQETWAYGSISEEAAIAIARLVQAAPDLLEFAKHVAETHAPTTDIFQKAISVITLAGAGRPDYAETLFKGVKARGDAVEQERESTKRYEVNPHPQEGEKT